MMLTQPIAPGLLLAAPPMSDPNFGRSVVLVAQCGDEGALGWVLNGIELVPVAQLMRDAGLTPEGTLLPETPSYLSKVRVGGPVSPRSAWLLYESEPQWKHVGEIPLSEHWSASGAREFVESIALGRGPTEFRLLLGYAGWAPGQLDHEIRAGAWMPTRIDEELVFGRKIEGMWQNAYEKLVGVTPFAFSGLRPGSA